MRARSKCTWPLSETASSVRSAEDERENLQKTTPLVAMRSVLQYCRSGHRASSSCSPRLIDHSPGRGP